MADVTRSVAGTAVDRSPTPFVDPLPFPTRYRVTEPARLSVRIQNAEHRFHSELPPAPVWTYDGLLPGPMIDVDRGTTLEVLWDNQLEGVLPVTVVRAPSFTMMAAYRCSAVRGAAEGNPTRPPPHCAATRSCICTVVSHRRRATGGRRT